MWFDQLSTHLDSLQAVGASNRLRASGQLAEADEALTRDREQLERIKLFKPEQSSHLGITLKCSGEGMPVLVQHLNPAGIAHKTGGLKVGMQVLQVNAHRVYSDRQGTDLLRSCEGELTILALPDAKDGPISPDQPVVVKPAAAPTCQAKPISPPPRDSSAAALDAAALGVPGAAAAAPFGAALAAGHFYLQPIESPPGLTLPAGLPPGGALVYLVPLPAETLQTPPPVPSKALHSVPEHVESRGTRRASSVDNASPAAARPRETYSQAGRPQCGVGVAPERPERATAAAYVEDDVLEQSLDNSMDLRM